MSGRGRQRVRGQGRGSGCIVGCRNRQPSYLVRLRVCFLVCLFVTNTFFSETMHLIVTKFWDQIEHRLSTKPIDFHESRSKVKVTKKLKIFKIALTSSKFVVETRGLVQNVAERFLHRIGYTRHDRKLINRHRQL